METMSTATAFFEVESGSVNWLVPS